MAIELIKVHKIMLNTGHCTSLRRVSADFVQNKIVNKFWQTFAIHVACIGF